MATNAQSFQVINEDIHELPTEDGIIALCNEDGFNNTGIKIITNDHPVAFVKYGYNVTIGEAFTQHYAYQQAMGNPSIKVPKIHCAFSRKGVTYIAMEYIEGKTVDDMVKDVSNDVNTVYDKVAKAVEQMLQFPVPENVQLGHIGGGYIHHHFFQEHCAPVTYASVDDLQMHINNVLEGVSYQGRVDFSSDKVVFYYSDINPYNFIVTPAGELFVIDFEEAGFLPESFVALTLRAPQWPLAHAVSNRITNCPKTKNLKAMRNAAYRFNITSEAVLASLAMPIEGEESSTPLDSNDHSSSELESYRSDGDNITELAAVLSRHA